SARTELYPLSDSPKCDAATPEGGDELPCARHTSPHASSVGRAGRSWSGASSGGFCGFRGFSPAAARAALHSLPPSGLSPLGSRVGLEKATEPTEPTRVSMAWTRQTADP